MVMAGNRSNEVPYQNYYRIKRMILSKQSKGDYGLYVDPSFPPDLSSLTYVYSGDDRYERTVFKRPLATHLNATFCGVGGVLNAPFPWRQFKKRCWFEAAVVVTSLSVRYLEKIVPGYRNCEQNFANEYTGAFHFNVWRFGEWIEIVVDDNLPVLDDRQMYCRAFGDPPEFWGPLLEKSYAKIMKAYEAIECGDTLDALTDLSGAICEFFTPDINPPENLFHIMYKSFVNRSFIVCWRNDKRLTHTGFHFLTNMVMSLEDDEISDNERFLHIVTAVSKFPISDGRWIEMVRLKCLWENEPKWNGKFSDQDQISWKSINSDFTERFRPITCKDKDEYWMSLEDFRCNFGGVIICSNTEPFRAEGFGVERSHTFVGKQDIDIIPKRPSGKTNSAAARKQESKTEKSNENDPKAEINVTEDKRTVKLDSTQHEMFRKFSLCDTKQGFYKSTNQNNIYNAGPRRMSHDAASYSNDHRNNVYRARKTNSNETKEFPQTFENYVKKNQLLQSSSSVISNSSDTESFYSTSDIAVLIPNEAGNRPRSAPMTASRSSNRNCSVGSLSHLTQSNFLATGIDYFRPHGAWKQIVDHRGKWEKNMTGASSSKLDVLSKNVRVPLGVVRKESTDNMIHTSYQNKSHFLISLLQDYRHGSSTANSLVVSTGLCVFKSKHPERDEKRHLSRLSLIFQTESEADAREVKVRLDLKEGHYFIVPFCSLEGHEGGFLLRVLGERNSDEGKNGCYLT